MAGKFTDYIKKNPNARPTTPPSYDWDKHKQISYERADAADRARQEKNKQTEKDNNPVR
ncbi:hypothetical protein [Larkinella arboricola]|uniref:hypothetical protein n=1 Tax=Larkinella arboricola TaxID=643671 RepID=UPI001474C9E4|nr:hypothetical protein [Larkinella arboricola]